jgi:hypothetical protein
MILISKEVSALDFVFSLANVTWNEGQTFSLIKNPGAELRGLFSCGQPLCLLPAPEQSAGDAIGIVVFSMG